MALSQIELSDRIATQSLKIATQAKDHESDTLTRTTDLYELSVSVSLELVTLYGMDAEKASREIVPVLTRYAASITQANLKRKPGNLLPVDLEKATVTRARRAEPVLIAMRAQKASVKDLTTVHAAITSQKAADHIAALVKTEGPTVAAKTVRDEKAAKTAQQKADRAEQKRLEELDTRNPAQKAVDAILAIENPTDSDTRLDDDRRAALAEYLAAQSETVTDAVPVAA